MNMNNLNNKPLNICNCIILFAVIYFSKDTLLFGTNADPVFEMILYASMPAIMLWVFFLGYSRRSVITNSACIAAVAYCGLVLLTMLVTDYVGGNPKYIYECLMVFLAFFVCTVIPAAEFKRHFVNIVSFLALVSLVVFALRYLVPGIVSMFPTVVNTNGYRYANLWLAVIPHDVAYVTFRNYGIFREPGTYQGFLNLALLFYFDDTACHRFWKACVLLAALVVTFSTAGYLICAAIILLSVFQRKIRLRARTVLIAIGGLTAAVLLIRNGIIEFDTAILKKLTISNSSTNSRLGSVLVDAYIGMHSPIWGNGFEYVEQNFGIIARDVFSLWGMSNTNTVLKIFAVHGIIVMGLFLAGVIGFCRKHVGRREWIGYALILALILSNEDMIFNTCVYIIMMYGYTNRQSVADENETDANQCRPLRQYGADHVSAGGPGQD